MTTKFVILSPGTPNYVPFYAQQCSAVVVNDQAYLIDAGDGVMPRLLEARDKLNIAAFAMPRITRVFFTHLHPDHTLGLPSLIIAPWVLERSEPLQIYGPRGTQRLVDHILAGYETGIAEHRDGLAPIDWPLRVVVHEFEEDGEIYRDENVTVEAFRVSHGGLDAFGLRFVSAEKTIVHSGDTCPQQSLIDYSRGCDILVHEVYMEAAWQTRPAAWQHYHRAVHTSGIELAKMAREIRPKLLVLNHQMIWGAQFTPNDLLAEIATIYDGEVAYAQNLSVY